MQVNIHQAKTHLSRLLERAAKGEEVIIARAGKPVARLVPWRAPRATRRLGLYAGQVRFGEDFDELPDDVRSAFEGNAE